MSAVWGHHVPPSSSRRMEENQFQVSEIVECCKVCLSPVCVQEIRYYNKRHPHHWYYPHNARMPPAVGRGLHQCMGFLHLCRHHCRKHYTPLFIYAYIVSMQLKETNLQWVHSCIHLTLTSHTADSQEQVEKPTGAQPQGTKRQPPPSTEGDSEAKRKKI